MTAKPAGSQNTSFAPNVDPIPEQIRRKAWEILLFVSILAMVIPLVWAIYKSLIPPAPQEAMPIGSGNDVDVLSKLGRGTAVALVLTMTGLVGLEFWLFIQFGRRPQLRGYLGPVVTDAIARAEIARREDILREDLQVGRIKPELEPRSEEFKVRYRIPLGEDPPILSPGVTIDEAGRVLEYAGGRGRTLPPGLPGGGSVSEKVRSLLDNIPNLTADGLVTVQKDNMAEASDNANVQQEKRDW